MNIFSQLAMETNKNGRSFIFYIPLGATYDEGTEVLTEMISSVASMKQQAIQNQPAPADEAAPCDTSVEASI